jgi:putative tricarboxylic transport membrane protein
MHGLTPGPTLFQSNPTIVWAIIASMFIGNLLLVFMNLPMAGMWGKIALIPTKLLYPIILILSVIGAYSVNNNLWDIWIMFAFGIMGYLMKKLDIPIAPLVLTFVLGELLETSLLQSLIYFNGNVFGFFQRPISGTLLVISMIVLILSILASIKKKRGILANDVEM